MTHFEQLSPQLCMNQSEIPLDDRKYFVKTSALYSRVNESVGFARGPASC